MFDLHRSQSPLSLTWLITPLRYTPRHHSHPMEWDPPVLRAFPSILQEFSRPQRPYVPLSSVSLLCHFHLESCRCLSTMPLRTFIPTIYVYLGGRSRSHHHTPILYYAQVHYIAPLLSSLSELTTCPRLNLRRYPSLNRTTSPWHIGIPCLSHPSHRSRR